MGSPTEDVLEACMRCCERYGLAKTTLDDVAAEAGVSRATLYRIFPGGKETMFAVLRDRRIGEFLGRVTDGIDGLDTLEDKIVAVVVSATRELRSDEHISVMLASQPGEMMRDLSVDSLPQIISAAAQFLGPITAPYLPAVQAEALAEVISRMVISYFLAPSAHVDLADPASAAQFIRSHVLPAVHQESLT